MTPRSPSTTAPPDRVPRLRSVNVGGVRELAWRGNRVRTAIVKESVGDRPVRVRELGLDGDAQADRAVHGGVDKAVYAYALEDYAYWRDAEGLATHRGLFGENLTVHGLDLRAAVVGERWRIGSALLEVAQPRLPCAKLGIRLADERFPRRFLAAGRLGAYLRTIEPGELRAGDVIDVVARPAHGVTLALMAESLRDHSLRPTVLLASPLPERWWRST